MTSRGLLATAFAFFALNALTQGLVSGTADLDQAQQLVLSQALSLGYGTQPPLYTWIMHTLFRVTGPSIWTLYVFKVLLLTLLVGGAIRVGQRLGLDGARLSLAVLGFALLPQIVWESQRDLTHSLLATVCAMWTLAVFLRLRERPEPIGYVHMGLCIGLGLLGKYNYAFFLAALVLVALSFPGTCRAALTKYSIISAVLALVIVLPHAIWVLNHHAVATASVEKLGLDTAGGTGLLGLGNAAFQFAFPLLVAWLASTRGRAPDSDSARFLTRLLLVVAALLGLFVIVSGTTQIKDRWLQPLLFFLPFLVVLTTLLRARLYAGLAIALMLLVAISLPGRSLLADVTGSPQRPNLPYADLAEGLRARVGTPRWIVSDRELLAGNMRLAFPGARIDVVRDMAEFSRLERPADAKIAVFVSDDPRRGGPPGELAMALAARDAGGLRRSEAPMRHMAGMRHTLYWLSL
jgi:4-amino-4-deoxy-L-arabinose transferase-like glycosyltransferase